MVKEIIAAVTIPVMAKARIGHFAEAQVLQEIGVDMIDESEGNTALRKRVLLELLCSFGWLEFWAFSMNAGACSRAAIDLASFMSSSTIYIDTMVQDLKHHTTEMANPAFRKGCC